MKTKILIAIILICGITGVFWYRGAFTRQPGMQEEVVAEEAPLEPEYDVIKETIEPGDTFGKVLERLELGEGVGVGIIAAAEDVYDIGDITAGRSIDAYSVKETGELAKVVYQIDTLTELVFSVEGGEWAGAIVPIPYEIRIETVEGTVDSSLYQAGLDMGLDERAIIAFAEVFQWTVDFALDVRVGDSFKLIYEKRYRDGEYVMPGKILAAKYVNAGEDHYAFYFEESEENKGYFDEKADSVQRIFLKAPVAFKYITSGFTTGQRYVEAFNVSTGHRAIDYAAAAGTPVRAVGDGTVVFAGWHKFYGNLVSVRHNETYTTNYAHNSRLYVSYGEKVKQGDTIAAVGSTGFSTGPHLHYEMVKFGTKINPMTEEFPASEAIAEENKQEYFNRIRDLANQLGIGL